MSPMQDLQHAIHFGIVSHLHLVSGSSGKMQTHRWCDPNHLTPRSILSFWLILELDKNVLIGFPLILGGSLNMEHASPISWHRFDLQIGFWHHLRRAADMVWQHPEVKVQGFFIYISNLDKDLETIPLSFPRDMTGCRTLLSHSYETKHNHTSPNGFPVQFTRNDRLLFYMLWSTCSWPLQQQPTPHTHVHTHTHVWK